MILYYHFLNHLVLTDIPHFVVQSISYPQIYYFPNCILKFLHTFYYIDTVALYYNNELFPLFVLLLHNIYDLCWMILLHIQSLLEAIYFLKSVRLLVYLCNLHYFYYLLNMMNYTY